MSGASDEETETYVCVSDRDYADSTSPWYGVNGPESGSKAKSRTLTSQSTITVNNLQTSVYSNSMAEIVTCGDITMAAWIEDDSSRDTYNRMRLVYSLYDADANTWSEPVAVYDNGCNDASPSLATDGTNIYIAWQKVSKKLTEDECSDMTVFLENTEIYLAKYDESNNKFTGTKRITNDSYYDYIPSVTILDGSPVVYYAKKTDNTLENSGKNTIWRYGSNGTSVVLSGLNMVYTLECAIKDNKEVLAFSNYLYGDNEGLWSSYFYEDSNITLADNDGYYFKYMTYGDLNGETTLFASDGTNIYIVNDGTYVPILDEAVSINSDISFVKTDNGAEIFWISENECGNSIYACYYENGNWSEAVEICSRESSFSNLAITEANSKIIGIGDETILKYDENTESYRSDYTNLIYLTENSCADLELTDIFVVEAELVPGEEAEIYLYYKNSGNVTIDTVLVSYNENPAYYLMVNIKPGEEKCYKAEYSVPSDYNGESITISFTPTEIADTDLSDNSITYTCDEANLVFENEKVNYLDGSYIVSADLKNTNISDAENVIVKAYFGEATGTEYDSVEVGTLSNDEYSDISFIFDENDFEFDETGSCTVNLTAESDNGGESFVGVIVIQEKNECAHPEIIKEDYIAPTCTTPGYRPGTKCVGCGKYFTDGEEIPALGHADTNNDGYCDRCNENVSPCRNAKVNAVGGSADYRTKVTLKATADNVPAGYYVAIYDGNTQVKTGDNTAAEYYIGEMKSDKTYTVKIVDAYGNVQKDGSGNALQKEVNISVNASFIKKLVAFFKGLFGMLPEKTIQP